MATHPVGLVIFHSISTFRTHTHTHTYIWYYMLVYTNERGKRWVPFWRVFGFLPPSTSRIKQEPWVPRPSKSLECSLVYRIRLCDTPIHIRSCMSWAPKGYTLWWTFSYTDGKHTAFPPGAYLPGAGGLIEPSFGCSLVHRIRLCDDNNTPIHIGSLIGGPWGLPQWTSTPLVHHEGWMNGKWS